MSSRMKFEKSWSCGSSKFLDVLLDKFGFDIYKRFLALTFTCWVVFFIHHSENQTDIFMSNSNKSRNNHYVPQWYQKGFFEPERNHYYYLDKNPDQITLKDGRIVNKKSIFVDCPSSRAFCQRDLYSTFFINSINDEIERRLFGDIDTRGSTAVRAFIKNDVSEWCRHFESFFKFIDTQKIRTPKGLDWLRAKYPNLPQNELLYEMQHIRNINCTIWAEGVREIVSAEDAEVKFIVSDHPVTVYNSAIKPEDPLNVYPNDPPITLKGSQTIFPLNRDFCLILTNLEYAEDHSTDRLEKRTFAGKYRNSLVRTDTFIRSRKLTNEEVTSFNLVLKLRSKRFIAAGRKEWLYPEKWSHQSWDELSNVFLPLQDGLWPFGGEMFAKFESGKVYYQDAFGRTEPAEHDFLKKSPSEKLNARGLCGCGSGRTFGDCCRDKRVELRPTWTELGIRERNLLLFDGLIKILEITEVNDWTAVRRRLTDEKIRAVYGLHNDLWPRETNLLEMLPKPDGTARAVYTGILHPDHISNCALGLSLYFKELLIEHPFVHPGNVQKKFSPLEHPSQYRFEFLKSVLSFIRVMPLVEHGLVTLFPDPCIFNHHLQKKVLELAKSRQNGRKIDPRKEAGLENFEKDMILQSPVTTLQKKFLEGSPDLDENSKKSLLRQIEISREQNPLAVLQSDLHDSGKDVEQLVNFTMAPNFEITMFLAQATGACIATDSKYRWQELQEDTRNIKQSPSPLNRLRKSIEDTEFVFPCDVNDIIEFEEQGVFRGYPDLMKKIFNYLVKFPTKGPKMNFEEHINSKFNQIHASMVDSAKKSGNYVPEVRTTCLWPIGGLQYNTINRLLLMHGSEYYLTNVPMILFFERGS